MEVNAVDHGAINEQVRKELQAEGNRRKSILLPPSGSAGRGSYPEYFVGGSDLMPSD